MSCYVMRSRPLPLVNPNPERGGRPDLEPTQAWLTVIRGTPSPLARSSTKSSSSASYALWHLASGYKKRFGDLLRYDVEDEIAKFKEYRVTLSKYVVDAVALLEDAQNRDTKILIEGGQALMLDLTFGTYPCVTSSSTGLGGVLTGLGLNPRKLDNIVGVMKVYTTRVGGGPFPTEDTAEIGTKLKTIGREVGVSTGRRCGWLDLVVVKYSHAVNHYDTINLTKLDILDTFPTIKVATGYKHPDTKEPLPSFPADLELLGKVEVEYVELPGWNTPTTSAKTFFDLPKEARDYVLFIEKFLSVNGKGPKIRWIGTGPGREAMIDRGA
ncbi:hypothetical protein ACHAQA_005384 [Verticillium albo-atrum]